MTRDELVALLERYADGDLSAAEADALARALREDESAFGELEMAGLLGEALAGDDADGFVRSFRERRDAEEKGTDFIARLDRRVAAERLACAAVRPRRRLRRPAPATSAIPWVAAVAAFGLIVALAAGLSRPAPPAPTAAVAPPAAEPPPEPPRIPSPSPPPAIRPPLAPAPPPPVAVKPENPVPPPAAPVPSPVPAPAPPSPPPPPTQAAAPALVRVDRARDAGRLQAGHELRAGDAVETGPGGSVLLRYPDDSTVELRGGTALGPLADGPAKRIQVLRGTVILEVVKQARPMTVATAEAEITVLGTRFSVAALEGSTQVEVDKGAVQVLRRSDRRSIRVTDGHIATVAPKVELAATVPARFVKGINFNGAAATIEGNRWLSHQEALADGLVLPAVVAVDTTTVTPNPPVDADMNSMLNTVIWRQADSFSFRQRIANGLYDLYFWEIENLQTGFRSFRIKAEGGVVVRNGGALPHLKWTKHGPHRVAVADGWLDLELVQLKGDPNLMGMAIFTVPTRAR